MPYQPGKRIDELRRELGLSDIVKLASNENPYGPSPLAIQSLSAEASHRYPDPNAHDLRKALAKHHGVAFERLCLGNGSNELIDMLVRVFCTPDDHVVFGDPSFLCYRIACVAANVPHTTVPLVDHLHWSVEDLLEAVQLNTKILFLANPNNPTGAYVARADLSRLLDGLPEQTIAVIDEAYVEFVDAQDYSSALDVESTHENLVVLRTFSKAYGLAALRVGYAVSTTQIIADLNRLRAPFNVNSIAQRAAIAALGDTEHMATTVVGNKNERRRMQVALTERGFEVAPSQANFLLFRTAPRTGAAMYEDLLKKGVIVRKMPLPIETWVRVTVGTPAENDRLLSAIDSLEEGA